jgi:uncharacterized membrane protein
MPQRLLAERFARGDITEQDYARWLAILADPRNGSTPEQ